MLRDLLEESIHFSPRLKQWIGKAVGGALVADGKIDPNEKAELAKLFKEFQHETELIHSLNSAIDRGVPPILEPIKTSPAISEKVLALILKICASDFELQLGELRYLNQVGLALSMDASKRVKLIRSTVRGVKLEFFREMLNDIYGEERYWLASVILKTIYADGKVDRREIPYLNSVFELLKENPDELAFVKADAKNPSLDKLPEVHFDPELAARILKYLLEIVMNDEEYDEREINFIHHVAQKLHFTEEDVEELTKEIEQSNVELSKLYEG